jgi:hypothetical protein
VTQKQAKKVARMFSAFVIWHSADRVGWEESLSIEDITAIQKEIKRISLVIYKGDEGLGTLNQIISQVTGREAG